MIQQRRREAALSPTTGDDIDYVYHPSFNLPGTEKRLWGSEREEINVVDYDLLPQVDDGTTTRKMKRNSLSASEEKTLFLRYNYAKFQIGQHVKRRKTRRQGRQTRKERRWRRRAEEVRERIVHANLPLVPSMARRMKIPGVEFSEMLSEGYMAVLRCVEKFDVSRGFKFSTYTCRSILSSFHRLGNKSQTRRKHIPVYFDVNMEKSDYDEMRHEEELSYAQEAVRRVLERNLADLSEIEAEIIHQRFPVVRGDRPRTLAQVGRSVGLSNERVRQIEKASLSKLRMAIEKEFVA